MKTVYIYRFSTKRFIEVLDNPGMSKVAAMLKLGVPKSTYMTWMVRGTAYLKQVIHVCNTLHIPFMYFVERADSKYANDLDNAEWEPIITDSTTHIDPEKFKPIKFLNTKFGEYLTKTKGYTFKRMSDELGITQIGFNGWYRTEKLYGNIKPDQFFSHCQMIGANPFDYIIDRNIHKDKPATTESTEEDPEYTNIEAEPATEESTTISAEQHENVVQDLIDTKLENEKLTREVLELHRKYNALLERMVELQQERNSGYVMRVAEEDNK